MDVQLSLVPPRSLGATTLHWATGNEHASINGRGRNTLLLSPKTLAAKALPKALFMSSN